MSFIKQQHMLNYINKCTKSMYEQAELDLFLKPLAESDC